MVRNIFNLPKPKYDITGRRIGKKRKPFSIRKKKIEWMRAAGRDPYGKFVKTSRCRNYRRCHTTLKWGDRTYDFDHKDNNSSNDSQKNCYLVCRNCHGHVTKTKKRKVRDRLTGLIRHQTIKMKVGYKKVKRKKKKKSRRKKSNPFEISFNPF